MKGKTFSGFKNTTCLEESSEPKLLKNEAFRLASKAFNFAQVLETSGNQGSLPATYFGEWWGSGVQRGYGLQKGDKRFSLFNVSRWALHGTQPKLIPNSDPTIE